MATFAFCVAASWFVLRRDRRASMFMIAGGGCGLVFSLTLQQSLFEVAAAAILLIAVGVILAPRSSNSFGEMGESTATRRKR